MKKMSKKTKELRLEVNIIVTMALIVGLVAVWCTFYYVYHIYPTQTYHVFPLVTIAPAFLSNCLFLACLFSYIVRRIQLSKQYQKDEYENRKIVKVIDNRNKAQETVYFSKHITFYNISFGN